MPVLTSAVGKLGTFAQLLAGARVLTDRPYQVLAISLAVSSAVQILTESGCIPYYSVIEKPLRRNRHIWNKLVGIEAISGLLGYVFFVPIILLSERNDHLPPHQNLIFLALGLVTPMESVVRCSRVVLLHAGERGSYAIADMFLGLPRYLFAFLLVFSFTLASLACVLGSFITLAFLLRHNRARANNFEPIAVTTPRLARNCVAFGLPVTLAALYAQGPAVIVALVSSPVAAATYATAARFTQPLEIIPGSIVNATLPTLRTTLSAIRRFAWLMLLVGVSIACFAGIVGTSALRYFTHAPPSTADVLLILAIALIPKSLSYAFAGTITAAREPGKRLLVNTGVALIAIASLFLTAPHGAVPVAYGVVGTETLLVLALGWLAATIARDTDRNEGIVR